MTKLEQDLTLGSDFPQSTREQWRNLVDAVLRGSAFENLTTTTYDGLRIEPLAAPRPDAHPIAIGADPAWQIMARLDQPDPMQANAAARQELENGATGLSLVFAGSVGDYGFGIPQSGNIVDRVLDDIDTSNVAIEVDALGPYDAPTTAASGNDPLCHARIGQDPLGSMAVAGGAGWRWSDLSARFASRLASMLVHGYRGRIAAADGRVVHNAGGSEAQELAFVLAVALAYLRAMESVGLPLEQARRMIFLRLAADADQFLTIAKFRALRKLWGRVEACCGLAPEPAFVSAETAWRMMTQRDVHTNILRTTIAAFAATVGGADAITVLPFTLALGLPDDFARRIARNTQLILREEAELGKVADPAAGSGAIEDMTDQLCRVAWSLFQEIESAGGAASALERGLIQRRVAAVRAQRQAAIASRKEPLTGVSIFPELMEKVADRVARPAPAPASSATIPVPGSAPRPGTEFFSVTALSPIRLAQPFEALRQASDRALAATGTRPRIFLACLGSPATFGARTGFAKNVFEAGGIEAVCGEGDVSDLGVAFSASNATLACLCGSDESYERDAAALATALKDKGARHIYIVLAPGARASALKAWAVDTIIDEESDALAVLQAAHRLLAT